jgi:hypothetical protein
LSESEAGVGHAERSEDALLEERVERLAGGGFNDEAEHVGAEVGILVTAARLASERRLDYRLSRFGRVTGEAPEVAAGRKAGAMLEEHADRDSVLVAARELGDVFRDRIVERDLALVEQDHERGGRSDDLGQ